MRQQLDELIAAGFGNTADIIRIAVQQMYTREIGTMASKVSVKVAGNIDHENAHYVTLTENGLTEKFVAWTGKDGKGLWIDYGAGAKQIEGRAQFSAGANAAAAIRRYFAPKG
jgi:hypothetical protein